MKILQEFDHEKATQEINFFARKEGGAIDKLKVIKLMWLADRYHLRKYGRPISNDTYLAMGLGPVGSSAKDLADKSDFLSAKEKEYCEKYLKINRRKLTIKSAEDADLDVFSESDIAALNIIYDTYGKCKASALVNIAHEYPEWKKFEKALNNEASTRENMSYLDFFDNPASTDKLAVNVFTESDAELNAAKEIFNANYAVSEFWS